MSKKNRPQKIDENPKIHTSTNSNNSQKMEEKANHKNDKLKNYLAIFIILLITYFSFNKVKNYDFVNWDDPNNAYENKLITSLNKENFWENTKQIFKTDVIGNYNPLPIWTFALEQKFRGSEPYTGLAAPGGWHMTNLWLHLISVILVFWICKKLGLSF